MEGPVYVYYELRKFYQNHRSYVKSRSYDQLMGGVRKIALGSVAYFVFMSRSGPSLRSSLFVRVGLMLRTTGLFSCSTRDGVRL